MSGKKVTFGGRPTKQTAIDVDSWVQDRNKIASTIGGNKKPEEKMKRLTIDITEKLHRAIKSACALRGTKIADEVRELLKEKYDFK